MPDKQITVPEPTTATVGLKIMVERVSPTELRVTGYYVRGDSIENETLEDAELTPTMRARIGAMVQEVLPALKAKLGYG